MAGMCLACFIFLSVPNNLVEFHPRSFSMSWGLFQLSQQIKEKNSATVSTRSSCISVFGIQHWLTTAYHQQADGLNGWLNQTFYNSSAKFAQENRKTWDVKSNEVVYTFKTAVQDLTKHTPFEARFGRVKSGTATHWFSMAVRPMTLMRNTMLKSFELATKCRGTEDAMRGNTTVHSLRGIDSR